MGWLSFFAHCAPVSIAFFVCANRSEAWGCVDACVIVCVCVCVIIHVCLVLPFLSANYVKMQLSTMNIRGMCDRGLLHSS